jgi:hypothetical protein
MIFTSAVYEDISRYYRNTYVKFKEHGDRLFFIRAVGPDSVRGTDEEGTEFVIHLDDEHPYEVDYILPRKSLFQYGKRSCMLQRIPAKQYQRGLSNGNTSIQSLNKMGGLAKHDIGFDVLKCYVAKQAYPSMDVTIANKARNISTAMSQRISYVHDCRGFFVDNVAVATLDKPSRSINMLHKVFTKELQELAKDSHFKVVA